MLVLKKKQSKERQTVPQCLCDMYSELWCYLAKSTVCNYNWSSLMCCCHNNELHCLFVFNRADSLASLYSLDEVSLSLLCVCFGGISHRKSNFAFCDKWTLTLHKKHENVILHAFTVLQPHTKDRQTGEWGLNEIKVFIIYGLPFSMCQHLHYSQFSHFMFLISIQSQSVWMDEYCHLNMCMVQRFDSKIIS